MQVFLFNFTFFFAIIVLVIEMDCIFCKIIKGEIPSYKLYEDGMIMIFLDVNPYCPGHALIVPKEHTLDINSISDDVLMHIMKHARITAKNITEALDTDGFTLIQNNGFVQEVKHFHLHVIPKYSKKFEMPITEVYEKITQKSE